MSGPKPARAIMLQGTGSDVGKSVLVAALCRIASEMGISVAPFKPQNMSNNAHACSDGGEIGRAQAMQAMAARVEPQTDFNPVLLKPESDQTAQVVVHGKPLSRMAANHYMSSRDSLLPQVLESFHRLGEQFDLVIVEGAGSPAEVNLRERDIANMGFATAAGVPVCLVGDIDRGGVIAALAGTQAVLSEGDAAYIQGFLINKFRGDRSLFDDGVSFLEARTRWPCMGVIPWLNCVSRLPAEDAVVLDMPAPRDRKAIKIVAPMLSRIANFDDLDPLQMEDAVHVEFVPLGKPLPRDADVIILLGTKSTIADLKFLRDQGWEHDIQVHVRHGGRVLGLCGGYQMLGRQLLDPELVDGSTSTSTGLGLLDIDTTMSASKQVRPVIATCAKSSCTLDAYEIHAGITTGGDTDRPMFTLNGDNEGAVSPTGQVQGTYLHGLFSNDAYRTWWLNQIRYTDSQLQYNVAVDQTLTELAEEVSRYCDLDAFFNLAKPIGWKPGRGPN